MRNSCAAGRSTWTNSNCKSINHVLKQAIQWRHNQLPELIHTLRSLVDGQYADADRAMCGCGDYSLRPAWSKHRLTIDCWMSIKPVQCQKAVDACFRVPVSSSSDAPLTVPTMPDGGRKPHQKKCCWNERTTSVQPKRVRVAAVDVEPDSDNDFA